MNTTASVFARVAEPDSWRVSDVFAQLWATAMLWHLVGNAAGLLEFGLPFVIDLALAVTALAVIVVPRRTSILAAMAAVQVTDTVVSAPVIGNHMAVLALINLTLLVAIALAAIRPKGDTVSRWFSLFVPAARLVLLVAYAFMAFAKLNSGFVDRLESCAPIFTNELLRITPWNIDGAPPLQIAAIVGTIVAELSIPFLLVLIPRWGVPFAMAFHFLVSIDPIAHIFDFTSMLFVLFLLFWPPFHTQEMADRFRSWRPRMLSVGAVALALYAGLFTSIGVAALLILWPLWLIVAGLLLALVVRTSTRNTASTVVTGDAAPTGRRILAGVTPVLALVAVLTFANGLSPYLELKTNYGFNMYSNLRVEGGETNHFLIPRTVQLRDAHDRIAVIVESSDEDLDAYADGNLGITEQSLQVYLADNPDVSMRYEFDGQTIDVVAGERPAAIGDPPGWFTRKFGAYRAVDLDAEKGCLRFFEPAH